MRTIVIDLAVVVAFLATGAFLLFPRVSNAQFWRATVTPLASIIGSGFLVSAPLMAQISGRYAVFVMAALCLAAYFIGSAVRHNIGVLEKRLEEGKAGKTIGWLGIAGDLSLSVAYVISICFYVKLLSAFALKPVGLDRSWPADMLTTSIVGLLGLVGFWRGFGWLERLETYAVDLKLAVIAGLIAGLAVWNASALATGTLTLPAPPQTFGWHSVRAALGALLIIQGFETSRYLGAHYSPKLRVRSMQFAQLLASLIYVAFIALVTTLLSDMTDTSETAIIDYASLVSPLLPLMLTGGAIAAQLSAATADFVGSAGLAALNVPVVKPKWLYPMIAAVVIALTWATDVFGILTLASRAFAAYYAIQCVLALMTGDRSRPGRLALFSVGLVVSLATLFFGISAH